MKKKNIIIIVVCLVILLGVLVANHFIFGSKYFCWPNCTKSSSSSTTGLPNPASVHCEEVGGTLEIKEDASGGQVGFCTLPDKSVCEEWALLRNECL